MDIRKNFFYSESGEALAQVVDASSLATFKVRLNQVLGNLMEP